MQSFQKAKHLSLCGHFTFLNADRDIIRVIGKVTLLGAENGQFQHNRPSKAQLRMKIL
jgi:hypothetical protein